MIRPSRSDDVNPIRWTTATFKSPYTHEANVFAERQIIIDLGLRVGYVWKRQARQWDLINLARTRDLWTVPVRVVDPGRDGVAGTSDDGPNFTAWGLSTVTASRTQWQARHDYEQTYKNLDVTLSKRMSNRWSLVASYLFTWAQESLFGSPQNPNEDLNNLGLQQNLWVTSGSGS